jgi:hypothetical protein
MKTTEMMNDATVTIYRGNSALTVFAVHDGSWEIVMVLDENGAGVVLTPVEVEQALGLIEVGHDETGR